MSDLNDLSTNVSIHDDTTELDAEVKNDGTTNRLCVDSAATIVNNESPTRYQLKTSYDSTGTTLTSASDSVLYSYTGDGVLDMVAVTNPTTSNYEVAVEIDGTERIRITMGVLGSTLALTSGVTPIWTEVANKNFRFTPGDLGFTTSFRILAKATGANTTVYNLVMYRERV